MTRSAEGVRAKLMATHGLVMIALGLAICYVRSTMTGLFFSVVGGALASLLVATALVFLSVVDWICAIGGGYLQIARLRWFLLVATAAAACSLFYVFYPEATITIFCKMLGFYAGCLALGKLDLARSWRGGRKEKLVIYFLAGLAVAFSVALVIAAPREEYLALALIAAYSLFIGTQILLTLYLLRSRTANFGICNTGFRRGEIQKSMTL
jgi:hypothetical protein